MLSFLTLSDDSTDVELPSVAQSGTRELYVVQLEEINIKITVI